MPGLASDIVIRSYAARDAQRVLDLQHKYAQVYPGAEVIGAEVYGHPAFAHGDNILCAVDGREALLGYAPIFPQPIEDPSSDAPHRLWVTIKAHPEAARPEAVREALYERVLQRAREIKRGLSPRQTLLCFECRASETAGIAFALAKGCTHRESVYHMARDLSAPIPEAVRCEGIVFRPWRMGTEVEQREYLTARNAVFPEGPLHLDALRYFMRSPQWAVGTTVAAFAEGRLVGSVIVFWDPAEARQGERPIGYTEDIFVLPAWRRRGIASAMICDSLAYLNEHGLAEARLQVRAKNERALSLYRSLGYVVTQESWHLAIEL